MVSSVDHKCRHGTVIDQKKVEDDVSESEDSDDLLSYIKSISHHVFKICWNVNLVAIKYFIIINLVYTKNKEAIAYPYTWVLRTIMTDLLYWSNKIDFN